MSNRRGVSLSCWLLMGVWFDGTGEWIVRVDEETLCPKRGDWMLVISVG